MHYRVDCSEEPALMTTTNAEPDTTGQRVHAGPLSVGPASRVSARRAFSLIELLLVLAIMAIAAAIAAPRYAEAVMRYRVDMAARRIIADLEATRIEARVTSKSYTVEFDADNNTYRIFDGTDPDAAAEVRTIDLTKPPYETALQSASFNADSVVVFDGFGQPDSGGSLMLCVGDECRKIAVDAATGKGTIQ